MVSNSDILLTAIVKIATYNNAPEGFAGFAQAVAKQALKDIGKKI